MVHTLLTSYLQGVSDLKETVEKYGRDYELLSILQIRLKENIGKAQMYGETPENRADRMIILHELNEITTHLLGSSFIDFCQSDKPQDRHTAADVVYKDVPITSKKEKPDREPTSRVDARSEALKEALLSAFPTPGSLQQMASFCLEKNLAVIARGSNYGEIISNLVMWAEAHGETEKLITGARQMNSEDSKLRNLENSKYDEL